MFFPGVSAERYTDPPVELNFQYLKTNKLIKTRVRKDTGREQLNTENLFNVIMRNKLQPKSNECLFILTDSDLYPQENWTFVFGVTRPNLRTLIQSIARHDSKFPRIADYRTAIYPYGTNSAMEGGTLIRESKCDTGRQSVEQLKDKIINDSQGRID